MMRLRVVLTLHLLPLTILCGCGAVAPSEFAHGLMDSTGRAIVLDDVEQIVRDSGLTQDEKRAELRSLGIEDEKLISALLGL